MPGYPIEAVNTLVASRWTIWLAKIFGKRIEGQDGRHKAIMYQWRGKTYLTDFIET